MCVLLYELGMQSVLFSRCATELPQKKPLDCFATNERQLTQSQEAIVQHNNKLSYICIVMSQTYEWQEKIYLRSRRTLGQPISCPTLVIERSYQSLHCKLRNMIGMRSVLLVSALGATFWPSPSCSALETLDIRLFPVEEEAFSVLENFTERANPIM